MGVILAAIATVTAQWLPNWNRGFERVQRVELLARRAGAHRRRSRGRRIRHRGHDVTRSRCSTAPSFRSPSCAPRSGRTRGPGLELVRIAETGGEKRPDDGAHARALPADRAATASRCSRLPADPVVLVRAPYRVTFSYAGADRVWRNVWRGEGQLPKAIRVQVRDAATDRTLAVSTATLVHADMPADCVLAEVIADCLNRPIAAANRRADRCWHASHSACADEPQPRRLHHRRGAVDPRRARDARDRSSRSTSSMPRPAFTVHDERAAGRDADARRDRAQRLSASASTRRQPPSRGSFAFRIGNANVAADFNAETRAHRSQRRAEGAARRPVRRARRAARRPPTPMRTASSAGARRPAPDAPDESVLLSRRRACSIRRAARRSSTSRNSAW